MARFFHALQIYVALILNCHLLDDLVDAFDDDHVIDPFDPLDDPEDFLEMNENNFFFDAFEMEETDVSNFLNTCNTVC